MAAGIRALRKIQIGLESAHGSDHAATARLVGTLAMKRENKYYRPDTSETGKLSSYERSNIVGVQAKLDYEGDANYEQLGYLLGMSIVGSVSPTGAGPYVYTYAPNLTAASNPDTYTIEYGDDVQAFQSLFCYAPTLELSGSLDDVVKVKAGIIGASVDATTFTGAINAPAALSPIITGTGKLYIDSTWAGLGNTQKTATLIDFNWKTTDGIKPVKYADGGIQYTDRAEGKRHVELSITAAFNASSYALWTPYVADPQTLSYVRIKFTGPAISGGTDLLTLDGAYLVDDISELQDRDGQDIVKVKLVSMYDTTSSKEWSVVLTNGLSALP